MGESGCGKSTVARTIAKLLEPTSGQIIFDGHDITHLSRREIRPIRRDFQIVFQDPYASLNPRKRVHDIVAEPFNINGIYKEEGGRDRVGELVELVGLDKQYLDRYPHQLSGGQRQRIALARALALHPKLLILDEPVSSLDVSIQGQILNLLKDLQDELDLAFLFISHDLSVVRHISHRVAVMYLGRLVEIGERTEVYKETNHPYTLSLLSAVPVSHPDERETKSRIVLPGDVPSPMNPPSGCVFRTRCWKAQEKCAEEVPAMREQHPGGHLTACHFPIDENDRSSLEF